MFVFASLLLTVVPILTESAKSELRTPLNSSCACPGEVLTYTCTAMGIGSTIWRGTIFDCPSNDNEIVLLHSQFGSNRAFGTCNNRAVIGQSVGIMENDCFTSQLLVTVSGNMNNNTVDCVHNSVTGLVIVGTSTVVVVEDPYPPPDGIHLASVSNGTLTFKWNPMLNLVCVSFQYSITSNCGSCHNNTIVTETVCSGLHLSTNSTNCTFAIQSVVCGNVFGNPSDPIMLKLKIPVSPKLEIIPVYSSENKSLIKLAAVINQIESFTISGDISGGVTNYNVYFNTENFNLSSCEKDICEREVYVLPSSCPSNTNISITVTASNKLGKGPPSDPVTIECTNKFVTVEYDSAASTISCIYLNHLNSIEQQCSIQYWLCHQGRMESIPSYNLSNNAKLTLTSRDSYCYEVTATYNSHTIKIKGSTGAENNKNHHLIRIIIPIVVVIIVIIIVTNLVIFVVCYRRLTSTSTFYCGIEDRHVYHQQLLWLKDLPTQTLSIEDLDLKEINVKDRFIIKYNVNRNCQLKQYVNSVGLAFEKACTFYEFERQETISEDKELLFMHKDTGKYYYSCLTQKELREKYCWFGENVTPPSMKKYTVFVQSKGSGTRHLSKGSTLLCELPPPTNIDESDLEQKAVENDCTLEQFCEGNNLNMDSYSIYVELNESFDCGSKSDVIFMNKKKVSFMRINSESAEFKTKQLDRHYTLRELHENYGPRVFFNIEKVTLTKSTPILDVVLVKEDDNNYYTVPSSLNIFECFKDKDVPEPWKVFVLCLFREDMKVDGTQIIYRVTRRNPYSTTGLLSVCRGSEHFLVYDVSENDNDKSLDEFCKARQLEVKTYNSVFLEHTYFQKNEGARDVMRWNKKTNMLQTGPTVRCMLPQYYQGSSPGTPVDEDEKETCKMFVLSKAITGNFVLKKGTSILVPNPEYEDEKYHVFVANESEDKMRLSDFIEKRLNSECLDEKNRICFTRGKAFYEFKMEEDLRFYRDIVYLKEGHENENGLQILKSGVHLFYKLPDIHHENVKPPSTSDSHEKVFIQNLSQGSMCVMKGMTILYKVSGSETTVNHHKGINVQSRKKKS